MDFELVIGSLGLSVSIISLSSGSEFIPYDSSSDDSTSDIEIIESPSAKQNIIVITNR